MIVENSKPFSNGTEYEIFKENWCERCAHCKYRDDGFPEFPEHGGCKFLDAMENALFVANPTDFGRVGRIIAQEESSRQKGAIRNEIHRPYQKYVR